MKLIRALHPEIRIVSSKTFEVDYVASDETLDCYKEVIRASGWQFTNFSKNAPFVDSHDYGSIDKQLGKVIDFKVAGTQLVERVQWAADVEINKLAQLGWKMTEGGYLKAVSVGFFPVQSASRYGDKAAFQEALREMGISAEVAARIEAIFLKQEQIELSACIIGANPNALAKAHDDGCVRDADLDALGFTDEDMSLLHASAGIYERLSLGARAFVDGELRSIPFRKTKHNASPADSPDAARDASRRDAEFARKLAEITSQKSHETNQ